MISEKVDEFTGQKYLVCTDPKELPDLYKRIHKHERDKSTPVFLEAMQIRIGDLEKSIQQLMHMYRAAALEKTGSGHDRLADVLESKLVHRGQKIVIPGSIYD